VACSRVNFTFTFTRDRPTFDLNRGANIGPATLSFCIPRQVLLSRENFESKKGKDKVASVQVVKEYLGGGGGC